MGKINKRQRKFLSKKVLPHRKKGGVRRDKNSKGSKAGNEVAPGPSTAEQHRKTLPDGLDETAFLKCTWLSREACAAAGHDTCVAPFQPDEGLLEGLSLEEPVANGSSKRKKASKGGSASTSTSTSTSGGLTATVARAMIGRAVDEASVADLLRVVWALEMTSAAVAEQASSTSSASSSPAVEQHQALRAAPGSEAASVLRDEAMPRLHLAFRAHLGPERDEGDSTEEWEDAIRAHRQQLERAEAWPKLGGALLSFLTSTLDNVETQMERPTLAAARVGDGESNNNSSSSSKKGGSSSALLEGLARMRDHIPLLFPFPRLARRYMAFLLAVLETSDDTAELSLAFVRLYELSTSQPMPFLHDAFKGSYRCYRAAAERVGGGAKGAAGVMARSGGVGGGAGPLPLLRECFAELFGVEKPSAYLHSYVYIHELAREALAASTEVEKGSGKSKEAGPALRRLRSWDFLQSLLLWTGVVAAHPAKSSLGPLVPPLAKVLEITLQLSPGLYGAPRTLALSRAAQNLAAASGVFLPTSHHLVGLLELLHAREGRPCPTATASGNKPGGGDSSSPEGGGEAGQASAAARGKSSDSKKRGRRESETAPLTLDLSGVAGLGKEDLKLGEVHAAVSRGATGLIAREAACCYRWSAGMPELCSGAAARLSHLLDSGCLPAEGGAGRCRARVKALQTSLVKAAAETTARRARGSKHPGEAGPIDTFRGMEESTATQRLQVFKELS
ncbi:unnamed protein product [Scytosiphon promiscuus]